MIEPEQTQPSAAGSLNSALARAALGDARCGLPYAGAFFAALGLIGCFRSPDPIWAVLDVAVGAFLLALTPCCGAAMIPTRRASETVSVILLIPLTTKLAAAATLNRPDEAIYGAALLLGSSSWVASRFWRLAVSGYFLVGWAWVAVAWLPPTLGLATNFLSVLFALAAAGSLVIHEAAMRRRRGRFQGEERQADVRRRLRESRDRYDLAVQCANDGLWHLDLTTLEFRASERWARMLAIPMTEMPRNPRGWMRRVHPDDILEFERLFREHIEGRSERFECKHRIQRADGKYIWVLSRGVAVRDESGEAVRIAGSQTDIDHVTRIEQQLFHDALHDAVTGLPNRNFFMRELQAACDRGSPTALVFVDLDRFKQVNDTMGHGAGDQLLKALARRLRARRRQGEIPARLGGDEFVVLMTDVREPTEPARVGQEIVELMKEPVEIDGAPVSITVSVGAAGPSSDARPEELLRNADIAMYSAKRSGRSRAAAFRIEMLEEVVRSWDLQQELRTAVREGALDLCYQPLAETAGGKIIAAEALLRWPRPDGRHVSTAEFIAAAEECGVIGELGEWVLRNACERIAAWRQAGMRPIRVCVNVSADQLRAGFVETVDRVLAETGACPSWLGIELTETALMRDPEFALICLHDLARRGIELALDDFGTGYSSLGYLQRSKFDIVKIDQSFIADIGKNSGAEALLSGIVSLARNLDMAVTAEGVETQEQLDFVRALRCDSVQGHHIGRPMPANRFADLVEGAETADALLAADAEEPAPLPPAALREAAKRV